MAEAPPGSTHHTQDKGQTSDSVHQAATPPAGRAEGGSGSTHQGIVQFVDLEDRLTLGSAAAIVQMAKQGQRRRQPQSWGWGLSLMVSRARWAVSGR